MKIHLVAGARPNFMKIAPLYHALERDGGFNTVLIHTGQHYDDSMSSVFLRELELPTPDFNLGVGSGSHATQTARVMIGYEQLCEQDRPDLTIVVGDVNSTLACTLAAKKLGITVAHLEAGLRSYDRTMPEEINRVVTDALADFLWTPSPDADENLEREGIPKARIARVGNIMIDAFEMLRERIESKRAPDGLGLDPQSYGIVTLHRPANVDHPKSLESVVHALMQCAEALPLVFPIHPRTRERLREFNLLKLLENAPSLVVLGPQSYVEFMSLVLDSRLVITDSGGIQEETTYLNIPCLTLRPNTERPITLTQGSNQLVTAETLPDKVEAILSGVIALHGPPEMWDGKTADRVVKSLNGTT